MHIPTHAHTYIRTYTYPNMRTHTIQTYGTYAHIYTCAYIKNAVKSKGCILQSNSKRKTVEVPGCPGTYCLEPEARGEQTKEKPLWEMYSTHFQCFAPLTQSSIFYSLSGGAADVSVGHWP